MKEIKTKLTLRNDSKANWDDNSQVVLLKGEVGIEFEEADGQIITKMKIGDGTTPWANLPYFSSNSEIELPEIPSATQVFQVDVNTDETDMDAINRIVAGATLTEGDIAIAKTSSAGKTFHTAYVYDDGEWKAMDGNYNAENVYFDEDLLTTTAIGNISLSNGQARIASTGKNLKEVWETIFVKEQNPKTDAPKVSFSSPKANASYEVGTKVSPSYAASLSSGSYSYGPATGVAATGWTVELKNGSTVLETLNTASGTFAEHTMDDGEILTFFAVASHNEGTTPVTNRGNNYETGKIAAGNKNATCSYKISSYRNSFYGTLEEKSELTNDVIRGLNKSGASLSDGSSFEFKVPVGAMRVVIAYPNGLRDLTSVKDKNASLAEVSSAFKNTIVSVNGNNGVDAISYKVYYTDYANANDTENTYVVTI